MMTIGVRVAAGRRPISGQSARSICGFLKLGWNLQSDIFMGVCCGYKVLMKEGRGRIEP